MPAADDPSKRVPLIMTEAVMAMRMGSLYAEEKFVPHLMAACNKLENADRCDLASSRLRALPPRATTAQPRPDTLMRTPP